jgi:hypothetical protein
MKQTESIQGFVIGAAHYYVSSHEGEEVILWVHYQDNTYVLEKRSESLSQTFEREVSRIAQDLLDHKHGVNFAEVMRQKISSTQ